MKAKKNALNSTTLHNFQQLCADKVPKLFSAIRQKDVIGTINGCRQLREISLEIGAIAFATLLRNLEDHATKQPSKDLSFHIPALESEYTALTEEVGSRLSSPDRKQA